MGVNLIKKKKYFVSVVIFYICTFSILTENISLGNSGHYSEYKLWEEIGALKERLKTYENTKKKKEKSILEGFYIGLGLSLASDDFNITGSYPVDSEDVPFGFDPVYIGNTAHATVDISLQAVSNILDMIKINMGIGYMINKYFAVEFNFDYLSGFTWENLTQKDNAEYSLGTYAYIYLTVLSSSFKYYPFSLPGKVKHIKPFIHAGFGWLFADIEVRRAAEEPIIVTAPLPTASIDIPLPLSIVEMRGYDSIDDMCYKYGIGADVQINTSIKLTIDYSYFEAKKDVNDLDFEKITGSIAYIF